MKPSQVFLLLLSALTTTEAYVTPRPLPSRPRCRSPRGGDVLLCAVEPAGSKEDDVQDEFRKPSFNTSLDTTDSSSSGARNADASSEETTTTGAAATRTVNERLLAELQQAADKEKHGSRSELSKKFSLDMFQSTKTDEERRAAIEEARNLNGVNPVVTGVASVVALATACALWVATTQLGVFFATHPVDSDWYVVQRSTAVFRNVAVGLVSLAAGFCGVTGLGIGLLTGRVAAGVMKGELDPTPLPTRPGDEVELPNVWDLMLNKKPNRRSGGKDLFGP